MVILPDTKIRDAIRAHPELKALLVSLDPRFRKLENRAVFATVGRWARVRDVARMGGMSLCSLLHTLNSAIGEEEALAASFPDCLDATGPAEVEPADLPDWYASLEEVDERDVRGRDDFFLPELENALLTLRPGQALRVIQEFEPVPLERVAEERGISWFAEKRADGAFQVTFHRGEGAGPSPEELEAAMLASEVMDVRRWREDPFELIVKRAQATGPGESFAIVQKFLPDPVIRMLDGMGFDHEVEQRGPFEFLVRFTRRAAEGGGPVAARGDDRVPVVLQSATPVVWPVIMRLMQSDRLLRRVRFDEVKVWKETERHMGWIARGKADITFSAVVAATKLHLSGADIRMVSVDVWNNFKLLTRDPPAASLADLRGRTVHLPLIRSAPPYAVTRHLLRAEGIDPEAITATFGRPFGRPEEMQAGFVTGELSAVLLREPEASYALFHTRNLPEPPGEIDYAEAWRRAHPGVGDLPNAGTVFKGAWLREHPAEAELFLEELAEAIAWVGEHRDEAADLCWDIMGHPRDEVRLFLDRVKLVHVPAAEAREAVEHYLRVLAEGGSIKLKAGLDAAMGLLA